MGLGVFPRVYCRHCHVAFDAFADFLLAAFRVQATEGNLEETASRLISTAYLMGSGDNISAMIIKIHPTAYPEPVVSAAEVDIMGASPR